MNVENIAGGAATGVLVFLGAVVAPQAAAWGAMASILATLGAIALAAVVTVLLAHHAPAVRSPRQLAYDAAWDHALVDLGQDVA